jgi:hypothetical protein
MDDTEDSGASRRPRQRRGAVSIDAYEVPFSAGGDDTGDMKDDLRPGDEGLEGAVVAEVALDEPAAGSPERPGLRRMPDQGHDFVTPSTERLEEMGADEPGGPGERNLHDLAGIGLS